MEDYKEIYEKCLTKEYHDSILEPLNNYLYEIVNHYDNDIKINSSNYEIAKGNFIKEIIYIFKIMIEKNNYYDIEEIISFAYEMEFDWTQIIEFLYLNYNKEEYIKNDDLNFEITVMDLTENICNKEIHGNYNFSLYYLLLCYKKYCDIVEGIDKKPVGLLRFFYRYSSTIISYFHLNDYSVEQLDDMYNDIINDFNKYISVLELNGMDLFSRYVLPQTPEKDLIKTIIDNRINKKRMIK